MPWLTGFAVMRPRQGVSGISAEYIPTAKNNLVAGFWDKMGFEKENADAKQVRYSKQLKNYQSQQFLYLKIV